MLLKTLSGVENTSVSQDGSTQNGSTNLGISIPSPPVRNRPHPEKLFYLSIDWLMGKYTFKLGALCLRLLNTLYLSVSLKAAITWS